MLTCRTNKNLRAKQIAQSMQTASTMSEVVGFYLVMHGLNYIMLKWILQKRRRGVGGDGRKPEEYCVVLG